MNYMAVVARKSKKKITIINSLILLVLLSSTNFDLRYTVLFCFVLFCLCFVFVFDHKLMLSMRYASSLRSSNHSSNLLLLLLRKKHT